MPVDIPSTRPLIDKLGIKSGMRVSLMDLPFPDFLNLLATRVPDFAVNRAKEESDLLFLGIETLADLPKIKRLIPHLKINGAMWIIYPKGLKTITEANVREAGIAAGLVDVKVVRFSETHTGLRFVIPLANRRTS